MRRTIAVTLLLFTVPLVAQNIDLINAEIFAIDRSHSRLDFTIGFLGMTRVRGSFNDYAATILYDDAQPERSSVTLVIDAASIDTASEFRDKDLKSEKFFDVAKHPRIVFQSTRIEKKKGDDYLVHGDLTIKGVTKAITIPMTRTVRRGADAAWGNIRIGGAGKVVIRRKDFNILGNEFWGDKTLSDEVEIELDILGNRFNYDRWSWQAAKEKPSIGEVLWKTVESDGAAAAAAQLRELRQQKPDDYNFAPGQIGIVVNRLMQRRKAAEALELLAVAREAFPQEPGFFARSGEAYAAVGKREEAIRMYEQAAALMPHGTESMEMLRRLKK